MNIFFISYCDDTTVRFKKLVQYLNDGWYQLVSVGISVFSITDWYKRWVQYLLNHRDRYKKPVQYRSITGTGTRSWYSTAQSQTGKEVGTVTALSQTGTRSW